MNEFYISMAMRNKYILLMVPWVWAVLDGFLAVFPPFVSIFRKSIAPTRLDLERVLVLHLAQYLLGGENPAYIICDESIIK